MSFSRSLVVFVLAVLTVAVCLAPHVKAQDASGFDLRVKYPDDWTVKENHTASLPNFGVFYAESPQNGYFWVQVTEYQEATAIERRPNPDTLGVNTTLADIPESLRTEEFVDGYVISEAGLENYFLIAHHGDRLFRFRIGHSASGEDRSNQEVAELNELSRSVLASIEVGSNE